SLMASWMVIKEEELIDSFNDLKLGVGESNGIAHLGQLQISSDFKSSIREAQQQMATEELYKMLPTQDGKVQGEVSKDGEGIWSLVVRMASFYAMVNMLAPLVHRGRAKLQHAVRTAADRFGAVLTVQSGSIACLILFTYRTGKATGFSVFRSDLPVRSGLNRQSLERKWPERMKGTKGSQQNLEVHCWTRCVRNSEAMRTHLDVGGTPKRRFRHRCCPGCGVKCANDLSCESQWIRGEGTGPGDSRVPKEFVQTQLLDHKLQCQSSQRHTRTLVSSSRIRYRETSASQLVCQGYAEVPPRGC
ncbi:hypothetical protein PIB30_083756, partial [Stylosanthes scabra]|nr:hypothetical protein [Stylosanthes scabra]